MSAALLALALAAAPRIAVLDVAVRPGVDTTLAQGASDYLVVEVRRRARGSSVMGADEIRTLIGLERQKQLLGCTESSCLAEIGGALGARQIVTSSITRFGDTYLLVLKVLDARTARVLRQVSSRFSGEGAILDVVSTAVERLFPSDGAPGAVPAAAVTANPSEPAPASHSHALSIGLGIGALACGGVAIYGLADVLGFQSEFKTNGAVTYAQASADLSSARNWQVASIVLGLAALGLATGAVFTW